MKLEDILRIKKGIESSVENMKKVYEDADMFKPYSDHDLIEEFKNRMKTTIGNMNSSAAVFNEIVSSMLGCEIVSEERRPQSDINTEGSER